MFGNPKNKRNADAIPEKQYDLPPEPQPTRTTATPVSSRSLLGNACRWLLVTSHVLWALEGAPVLVAESEELSKVDVVVRVVHLLADARGARGWRLEQEDLRGWTAFVCPVCLQLLPHTQLLRSLFQFEKLVGIFGSLFFGFRNPRGITVLF